MIAKNFRKYPEAMALQRPLPFAHLLVWATARPGVRILRTIRAARAAAFKAAGRVRQVVKAKVPAWWTAARKKAKALAASVREACRVIWAEVRVAESINETRLIGFKYWQELAPAWPLQPCQDMGCEPQRKNVRALRLVNHLTPSASYLANPPEYISYCRLVEAARCERWGKYAPYWGGHSSPS